jgi:hypothetical protein
MTEFDAKFGFAVEPSREGESFTLVEWRRLRAAIDSLRASTWVKFATVDGEVVVDGRASPYMSHVRLSFAPVGVEGTSCTVRAYNGKHELLIEPVRSANYGAPEIGEGLRMRWVKMRVPTAIIRPLLNEVRTYLPVADAWWSAPCERLAEVWLAAPIVAGWEYNEELGKMVPVFAKLAQAEPETAEEAATD